MTSFIDILNRKLGDALGYRSGRPRFAWCWAPEHSRFVYDSDDRTLLKKTWASVPAPDGHEIGRAWLLGEWRRSDAFDHYGFGHGIRIPFVREYDYAPYFETALAQGREPTFELTHNYIWALDRQMQQSLDDLMAEEHYTGKRNKARDKAAWREQAAAGYDANTGAFGNCVPGTAGGFLSFGGM